MPDLGSGGVWGAKFIVNVVKSVAPKLRIIILLHLGLVAFRFHFPKTRKILIFMIFGLGGRVHRPQNQLFLGPPK